MKQGVALVAFSLAVGAGIAQTGAPAPVVTGNAKVDKLLSQMTLDEKISMIHGASEPASTDQGQAGFLPGVPRLGIPSLRMADGPPGVLTRNPSTGMTATMGLAATFSRRDAEQNGVVLGRDARSLGIDIVLEPFINIYRDITFGRGYNTYGEDPVLSGQIGAALVRGTQAQGVMAEAKHYIAYDGGNDVVVDPQTLREIYVAPFVDTVATGVSSIMCSYNKINGAYACGNGEAQNKILRDEIGFKGFIVSDWGATHGTDFINGGLDLEMPGATSGGFGIRSFFNRDAPPPPPATGRGVTFADFMGRGSIPEEALPGGRGAAGGGPGRGGDPAPLGMLRAVQTGVVKEEAITRAVGRILYEMDQFGLLDKKPEHDVTPVAVEANAPILRKTGEDAAVLLKNDGGALPLKAVDLQSLAMIGPGAGQTVAIGNPGEKALGFPARQIGAVQALRQLNKTARVKYTVANDMTGTAIPAGALSHEGQPGLLRTDAKTKATQVDSQLSFTKSNGKPLPAGSGYTWAGTLTVPAAGSYTINLQLLGTVGSVSLDGKQVASAGNPMGNMHGNTLQAGEHNVLPTTDGLDNLRRQVELTAGPHVLAVTTAADTSGEPVQARLSWVTPEQRKTNYEAAVAAAKQAKTAVVFVWGRGRPAFALPGDQDKLIEDVAAVNANTIVVMNLSDPVAMPWLGKVKAVLQMWYPGDEGGWATANLLLGKVSPAGRLPFTWPKRLEDGVANDPSHPERSARGVDGKTTYSEGIYVGYRWYDKQNIEPLFPFGHGLSYTSFEYSDLKVARAGDGGLDVNLRLHNTGKQASDEVPQVYLGAPRQAPGGAQFAVRALAAFDRIPLKPGEAVSVTLHVSPRSLQYWSAAEGKWLTAAGPRTVHVGASSRDLRLQAETVISQ